MSQRKLFYMDNTNVVIAFLGILVMSMMVAFAASMAFEAPFMGLEKILIQGAKAAARKINLRISMRDQYSKI
ncbi:nose resistant to fluoxetine protein 6 [Elysia marginata]|uniref:Nose resistant to fluoxetine protein 6 n=1 Tax=Elysia marginata TaxID=1093978 RepID=A0AAV4GV69_9GAST|nr:nose resistant to fluoxetine protein 6 [Elysia marginata]